MHALVRHFLKLINLSVSFLYIFFLFSIYVYVLISGKLITSGDIAVT